MTTTVSSHISFMVFSDETPCIDDHQEDHVRVVKHAPVCAQIFVTWLHVLNLSWTSRHMWTDNRLARAVTKWNAACDTQLETLISYIPFTITNRNFGFVGDDVTKCKTTGGLLFAFGDRTSVPTSLMCKEAECGVPQKCRDLMWACASLVRSRLLLMVLRSGRVGSWLCSGRPQAKRDSCHYMNQTLANRFSVSC